MVSRNTLTTAGGAVLMLAKGLTLSDVYRYL